RLSLAPSLFTTLMLPLEPADDVPDLFPLVTPISFSNDTAATEIFTLSLHDALPICKIAPAARSIARRAGGRLAGASRPPSECQVLSRARKRSLAAEIVSSRCSRTPGSTGTRGPRLQSR